MSMPVNSGKLQFGGGSPLTMRHVLRRSLSILRAPRPEHFFNLKFIARSALRAAHRAALSAEMMREIQQCKFD